MYGIETRWELIIVKALMYGADKLPSIESRPTSSESAALPLKICKIVVNRWLIGLLIRRSEKRHRRAKSHTTP